MFDLQPKIYELEISFVKPNDYLQRLCQDMNIVPEILPKIEEDSWGIRGVLEIRFCEVLSNKIKLHIQKVHFKHDRTYIKDLEDFVRHLKELKYVQEVAID